MRIIKCFKCWQESLFNNLNPNPICSVDDNGVVCIKKRNGGYVLIKGTNFKLQCVSCGDVVYEYPNEINWGTVSVTASIFMAMGTISRIINYKT